jgi:hypothetical protein
MLAFLGNANYPNATPPEITMNELPTIKSAAALQITDAEYKALLEIRGQFASGVFHHDPSGEAELPNGFNMNFPIEESGCGTTACIGGWMYLAMQRDRSSASSCAGAYVARDRSRPLNLLFYPPQEVIDEVNYDDITPGAALVAIDTFLATGTPDWAEAVGIHHGEIEHAI